jgi:integrase
MPARLMSEADDLGGHAPVRAALRAQVAVAIAILSVAPVRLGNLARIRLEENLTRPSGPLSPFWLVFPGYDVKNRVELQFSLDERLTALIEGYVHQHRPALVRGSNEPWLFPGESVANRGGGHKTPSMFSGQITEQVLKAVGIRITAHQFRHAAAAIMLRHDPGNYEFVRRVLGHTNLQTTTRFYIGLETAQATERFGRIVADQLAFAPA